MHSTGTHESLSARRLGAPRRWLFLHGAGLTGEDFRGVARRLAASVAVHTPDLHALITLEPTRVERPVERDIATVMRLLRDGSWPAVLVGHSYGGLLALEVARRCPELVERLVLIEPMAFHLLPGDERAEVLQLRTLLARLVALVKTGHDLDAARLYVSYLDEAAWAKLPEPARRRIAESMAGAALSLHSVRKLGQTLADYEGLRVPTILVRGTRSPWALRFAAAQLVRALPRAALFEVAGAGHLLPQTHADELAFLLRRGVLLRDLPG